MNLKLFSTPSRLFLMAALMAVLPTLQAQTSPSDFAGEPDKTMAAAHESFVKGDMNKASDQISQASAYVEKEADQVSADTKSGVTKAGVDLDKLAQSVKAGTIKSGDELKKGFAKVDHALATAWHKTAVEAQKSGKDTTAALKKAGAGLEGAAKWSGNKLQEGAQASVEGIKKAGQGVETGAKDVGKWFQNLGDGIKSMGEKL